MTIEIKAASRLRAAAPAPKGGEENEILIYVYGSSGKMVGSGYYSDEFLKQIFGAKDAALLKSGKIVKFIQKRNMIYYRCNAKVAPDKVDINDPKIVPSTNNVKPKK